MPVNLGFTTQEAAKRAGFERKLALEVHAEPQRAKDILSNLQTYIRGRNGELREGQIRIVNTTHDGELAFAYKKFGWGQQYRKDRTAGALVGLLTAAGVPDAGQKVRSLLRPNGEANYRALTAHVLDQLLSDPQVKGALKKAEPGLSQRAESVAAPSPDSPSVMRGFADAKAELENSLYANPFNFRLNTDPGNLSGRLKDGRTAQLRDLSADPYLLLVGRREQRLQPQALYQSFWGRVPNDLGKDNAQLPDWLLVRLTTDSDPSADSFHLVDRQTLLQDPKWSGEMVQVWATVSVDAGSAPRKPFVEPKQQVMNMLADQGFNVNAARFGRGGLGATFLASRNGSEQVVKLLVDKNDTLEPQKIDGLRAPGKTSELYAAYLNHSSDPTWVAPLVESPSHYIVKRSEAEGVRYETLGVAHIKQEARRMQAAGTPLECVGLVMKRAPGKNVRDLLDKGTALPGGKAAVAKMARSALTSLRSLNQRGLIHRDIKPANMNWDEATGNVHFFDTGGMFKVSKRDDELPELGTWTEGYVHPDALRKGGAKLGTQRDLHALGLTLLQAAYGHLSPSGLLVGSVAKSITAEQMVRKIDGLSTNSPNPAIRADALRFMNDISNSGSMGHFIKTCMDTADTSRIAATQWADRTRSDQALAGLLAHPALQGA